MNQIYAEERLRKKIAIELDRMGIIPLETTMINVELGKGVFQKPYDTYVEPVGVLSYREPLSRAELIRSQDEAGIKWLVKLGMLSDRLSAIMEMSFDETISTEVDQFINESTTWIASIPYLQVKDDQRMIRNIVKYLKKHNSLSTRGLLVVSPRDGGMTTPFECLTALKRGLEKRLSREKRNE